MVKDVVLGQTPPMRINLLPRPVQRGPLTGRPLGGSEGLDPVTGARPPFSEPTRETRAPPRLGSPEGPDRRARENETEEQARERLEREDIRRLRDDVAEEARLFPNTGGLAGRPGSPIGPLTPQQLFQIRPARAGAQSGASGTQPPTQPRPPPEPRNRTNPASVPNFGHTFSRHGAGAQNQANLRGRAAGTGTPQGQWRDDQAAADFLSVVGPYVTEPSFVPIPSGLGQVILPNGEIVPATQAMIVPFSGGGIRTAIPYP
jgi:hypothetical protein